MYASEKDATEGANFGGSGFLVYVTSATNPAFCHLYAVTNKHVLDGGCAVIRMNRKEGGIKLIPTVRQNWFDHPEGDDVTVLPLEVDSSFHWWAIGTHQFLTKKIIDLYRLGWGDETFLVGRLITQDGHQKNAPVLRFGNISLIADAEQPIGCDGGRNQEGFLVECRSLSGFSGSPVFAMTTQTYERDHALKIIEFLKEQRIPPGSTYIGRTAIQGQGVFFLNAGPWLLGIDWGHVPLWKTVYERTANRTNQPTNYRTELNTGIACVLPAWRIMDVLNREELVKQREKEDEKLADLASQTTRVMDEDSVVADISIDEGGFSQADFEAALRKASRKIAPEK
jgi:hypothetical protein